MENDLILKQINELSSKDIKEIKTMWKELFNSEPPKFNRDYLERKIAHKIQEIAYGGIKDDAKLRLHKLKKIPLGQSASIPQAGSQLVREYHGAEHRVTILPDGQFDYQGKKYKSLSRIAKDITGTQWSGPAFFGLKK